MQDDPCTFYWQEELANSRTQSAPRSSRTIKAHYKEVPPRAVAGEARPLKRMRRDRDRGARAPIIRARNSWIGGSVLPSRKPARATTGATSAARPGETHLRAADCRAFHQPVRLMPRQVFSKCAAPLGGGPIRLDGGGRAGATMVALVSAGPSLGAGEAVAGRAARTPEKPATIERAQCRFHRRRQIERVASTTVRPIVCRDRA